MDVLPPNSDLQISTWLPVYVKRDGLLTQAQCEELIRAAEEVGFRPAVRVRQDGSLVADRSFLLSDYSILDGENPTYLKYRDQFIAQREEFNTRYDFALYADPEACLPRIKIHRYEGHEDPAQQGFISWHADSGPTLDSSQRKLSVSCLLNDASEFEGGEFGIFGTITHSPLKDGKAGDAVIFPSFSQHVVKRLTSGVRYVLILWFLGPRIR